MTEIDAEVIGEGSRLVGVLVGEVLVKLRCWILFVLHHTIVRYRKCIE